MLFRSAASHVIFDKGYGWVVVNHGARAAFSIYNDSLTYFAVTAAIDLSINTWYHFVGVADNNGKTIKAYLNGRLEGTTNYTGEINFGTNPQLTIGSFHIGSADFFNGLIDNVMIFNRALTAGEVWDLYMKPFGMTMPSFDITKMLLPSGQIIRIN